MYNIFKTHCFPSTKLKRFDGIQQEQFLKRIFYEDLADKDFRAKDLPNLETVEAEDLAKYNKQIHAICHEEILKNQRREQVSLGHPILRLWKGRLRDAITTKAILEQKQVHEKKDNEYLQERKAESLQVIEQIKRNQLAKEKEIFNLYQENKKHAKVLLEQIESHENERKKAYERLADDRKVMIDILEKDENERKLALERENEIKRRLFKDLADTLITRQKARVEMKKAVNQEDMKFLKMMDDFEVTRYDPDIRRKEKLRKEMAFREQIAFKEYETERLKHEREEFLRSFLVEEKWYKDLRDDKLELERKLREYQANRSKILQDRGEHAYEQALKRKRYIKRINMEYQELLKNVEMEKRLEKAKLREKKEKVNRDNVVMIQAQRTKRAQEKESELNEKKFLDDEVRRTDEAATKEAIRLLKNQPKEILQYLKPPYLREAQELMASE